MSHVTLIDLEVHDLSALRATCDELGLELCEGQKTFKWFGRHMGDYAIPEGFTKADMGKCDHVIKVKGNPNAYEIGVVKRRDGKPGYILMWDFWQGGYGLQAAVGKGCHKLCQQYAAKVTAKQAQALIAKGFSQHKSVNAQGEIILRYTK